MLDAAMWELHHVLPNAEFPHQTYHHQSITHIADSLRDQDGELGAVKSIDPDVLPADPVAATGQADADPGSTAAPARVPDRIVMRIAETADFDAATDAVVERLAEAGYEIVSVSDTGVPHRVVEVRAPSDLASPGRPVRIRLMGHDAVDAYRDVAEISGQRQLAGSEADRLLTERLRPPGSDAELAPTVQAGITETTVETGSTTNPEAGTGSGGTRSAPPAPIRVAIDLSGLAVHDQSAELLRNLPEQMPMVGRLLGFDAVDGSGQDWSIRSGEVTARVEISVETDPDVLAPGTAEVTPGHITVSGHLPRGVDGAIASAAMLRRAMLAYGDLINAGLVPTAETVPTEQISPPAETSPVLVATGASIRPQDQTTAQLWAQEAAVRFRRDDRDIEDMANVLAATPRVNGRPGFSRTELADIKRHLFRSQHGFPHAGGSTAHSRFVEDADIVDAWIRLREGRLLPEDVLLLEHEAAEAQYLRDNPGATYDQAHAYADSVARWDSVKPAQGPTHEDLDQSWPDRPTPTQAAMFTSPTTAELAAAGVGSLRLADLGHGSGQKLSQRIRQDYQTLLARSAPVSPYHVDFTAHSVQTQDGQSVHEQARTFRDNWKGRPIPVVRWGDGSYAAIDNVRLLAARQAGLESVPVAVFCPPPRLVGVGW
jgi:hypothetical protein